MTIRHATRSLLFLSAAIMLAVLIAAPRIAGAQTPELRLEMELNKIEEEQGRCMAYLLFRNDSQMDITEFEAEMLIFDTDFVIQRRIAVNAAPIFASKTSVKLFELAGVACKDVGQILLNDFYSCTAGGVRLPRCLQMVTVSSRADGVRLFK